MKLAIVSENVVASDGQGRVNYETARAALRRGFEVTLLAYRVEPDLLDMGARWVRITPRVTRPHLAFIVDYAARVDGFLSRHKNEFDVIHANGYVLTCSHHLNSVHLVHGAWVRSPVHTSRVRRGLYGAYQRLYSEFNARTERRALKSARVVAAVSEKVRRELIAIGIPENAIRVIYNGVDLDEFCPGRADRAPLGLPENAKLGLFVGDIRTPLKNLDTVLQSVAAIPQLHLAVAGAVERSPYPALAERLGIGDRVHFLGFRRDIPALMRASDLFIFPSRYESFSLVILEALASGLPVVTASTVGCADLIDPTAGVVLADPNDSQRLIGELRDLLAEPERLQRMKLAARLNAERFSWARMTKQYLDVYEEIASQPLVSMKAS